MAEYGKTKDKSVLIITRWTATASFDSIIIVHPAHNPVILALKTICGKFRFYYKILRFFQNTLLININI